MAAAQAMWASGQGQVRGEGTRQGVVAGAWWRVADVGAGHQGSDAPQRLLVDEQFLEEFPECVGGGVVAAPQGHLGPGVEQRAFAGLASVAQQLQDLPAETAGLRDVSDLRLPFQYRGSHSGQAQFTGEHQAGGAGAHDDDAGVRHWPLPPTSHAESPRRPLVDDNSPMPLLPLRRSWLRLSILRQDPGLAASPPVRYRLKVGRSVQPLFSLSCDARPSWRTQARVSPPV